MDARRAERMAALVRSGMDWERLWVLAGEHRLRPLLYYHLKTVCPDAPAPLLARLQTAYATNARRGLERSAELLAILKLFESNGISALAYKGPLLAARVYRSQALREMRDLDLLVYPHDAARARELLIERGYQPRLRLSPRQAAANIRYGSEQELVWASREITIDLHWRLAPYEMGLPLTLARLQPHVESYSLATERLQTLKPDTLLLVCCIHGALHGFSRLFWLCDVAEMIRLYPDTDYDALFARADRLHATRLLALGLHSAWQLLDAPLPAAAQRRVAAERGAHWLAGRVLARLGLIHNIEPGLFEDSIDNNYYRMRERRRDVLSFYVQRALVGEWNRLGWPGFLFPLYAVMRWLGLGVRYGGKIVAACWQRVSSMWRR